MSRCDLVVNKWSASFRGRTFSCSVGRGGIGEKRGEGDTITPAGRYRIIELWHRRDRIRFWGKTIGLLDAWCDDPGDPRYNNAILSTEYGAEKLRRADPLYDLVAVLNYNSDPVVAGLGSAIFLHVWRKPRHPTAGCIAFDRQDLFWILCNWQKHSEVLIKG